ncbi:PilZ domain-containing protein [Anoxybacillus salavatliensis]|uniref:PilZ domain-containing protein n=1 Tax=Anoxybacillus gonensis TaxID=198467 RepID=UPI00214CCAD1|nr:PilZ domain-containing protein [Anoxybacillus gonensis]MCQ5365567.1 PilZ domain-containing protein [Anoxybacillus gonensis]
MRFKRQEPFRYQFDQPIPCTFRIIRIGEREVETDKGAAEIHDISPRGIRMETKLHLPIDSAKGEMEVELQFTIVDQPITVRGVVIWKKTYANEFQYGISLEISKQEEMQLIGEIKRYAAMYARKKESK